MTTLSEYLRQRGLELEPTKVDEDPILESDELVEEASRLWEDKQSLLTMIIQARVNAIGKHIMEKAIPEEVPVLRQALVEIGAIITDFESYKGENARRRANTQNNNSDETEEKPTESIKKGEEGSL